MNIVFLGVIAYVLVQFAVGMWVSRRIRTNTDFVIAGRSLGLGLVSFTVFGSFFGAEAIVGTAGSVYERGLAGAQVDPFGYTLAILIFALIFAVPLWRRGLITFADFFRERYSPAVERLVVLVLLPGSIFWAAAQVRAFGQVVSSTSGINVTLAISVATLLVVSYSAMGGLLADAWTDFVQGICIVTGLLILAAAVAGELGGLVPTFTKLEPERLRAFSLAGQGGLGLLERLAIPICGTVVAVEMVSRILGARSAETGARGAAMGAGMYLLVGLVPVYLGLAGSVLVAGVSDVEQIVPIMAEKYLSPVLYVTFAGAVISAILSTVDTVLLASAAQVSHNVIRHLIPDQSDRGQLLTTRLTVVALAVVAFSIALSYSKVKDMVEIASAAGSSGVFIVAAFGLFTRVGGPAAALATIATGALAWVILGSALELSAPYIASLALALATYVSVAAVEAARAAPAKGG